MRGPGYDGGMAQRSQDPIVCECGHQGTLYCKENDAPFSRMYEDYSLSGFEGESISITDNNNRPADLLAAMKPKCPACGQVGKVKYA
jgi:hypothetical protein